MAIAKVLSKTKDINKAAKNITADGLKEAQKASLNFSTKGIIADELKKTPKRTSRNFFQKIDKSDGTDLIGKTFGIELTDSGKILATSAIVGILGGKAFGEEVHKGNLGQITPGQRANMVNESHSPGIVRIQENLVDPEKPHAQEEIVKKTVSKNQAGVEPEIVFALHELRGGEY